MKMKFAKVVFVLVVVAIVSAAAILAVAAPGTQDNPFITMNYLENVFRAQMRNELRNAERELQEDFEARIAELEEKLEQMQEQGVVVQQPGSEDRFSVVTLSNGQSLTCSVGVEIMLRIGTATAMGSTPALVNYTNGETLEAGNALVVNNMYLVTIESNGIRATSETVRVLVRGSYAIG